MSELVLQNGYEIQVCLSLVESLGRTCIQAPRYTGTEQSLVDSGQFVRTGEKRGTRYEIPNRSG